MFTAKDYAMISNIVFQEDYPGYRPNVIESPDGDDKWDDKKRYAHVAEKYLREFRQQGVQGVEGSPGYETYAQHQANVLGDYLRQANEKAIEIAVELGVPKEFWPVEQYGALRILEYPPGAVTNPHYDFDLFTLMCYRNIPNDFKYIRMNDETCKETPSDLVYANTLNQQIHFGEILELQMQGVYKATRHRVIADPESRIQYSIVYFAIPDWETKLPDGQTVGEWLEERLKRSRKEAE